MKAEEKQIIEFLSEAKANFIIPYYQRNYTWGTKECEQLFSDLTGVSDVIRGGAVLNIF